MTTRLHNARTFPLVLGGAVAVAGYYALVTHLAFAGEARRLLAVHFAVIPDRPGEALAIWLHNSRLVAGIGVCAALALGAHTVAPLRGRIERAPLLVGDALLGLWAFGTVFTASVLLGAYGSRQAQAFWPYAPIEVTGWMLLLSTYIDVRLGRAGARRLLIGLATVEALLALAAVLEWVLCLRCERAIAGALDGIVSAAYPDVRIGYEFLGPPKEVGGRIARPGHVLRFRKQRSFVYPIVVDAQPGAARPLEAIAQAQAAAGVPSSVRFQMTPCALPVERYARERLRQHEAALAFRDGGVLSSLGRTEMQAAARSQSHTWCWLEVQVAAPSREIANRIAAAVQARRGENRLQRRWMVWREDLYRDRFVTAYPPLLPGLTLRTLVSASEVAQLIALPGGRLKNVPVRRLALPRIPAPPALAIALEEPGRPPARDPEA